MIKGVETAISGTGMLERPEGYRRSGDEGKCMNAPADILEEMLGDGRGPRRASRERASGTTASRNNALERQRGARSLAGDGTILDANAQGMKAARRKG